MGRKKNIQGPLGVTLKDPEYKKEENTTFIELPGAPLEFKSGRFPLLLFLQRLGAQISFNGFYEIGDMIDLPLQLRIRRFPPLLSG